ncbi:fimbrial protein, partial [Escherichia coli]
MFSKYSVFFIFFAFFAFPLSGQANDSVVVTFTGILLAKSCDITTGSKDQSVKMGTYDAVSYTHL